jgi:hypothetical protein
MSKLRCTMVAPAGAWRSAADHSALPITIPQIVTEAGLCSAVEKIDQIAAHRLRRRLAGRSLVPC